MRSFGEPALVEKILDDHTQAPEERHRLLLGFIKKLFLTPDQVAGADVKPLLAGGWSREAVRDAIYVTYLFSTYTRLADALGWEVPGPESFAAGAKMLLGRGYA